MAAERYSFPVDVHHSSPNGMRMNRMLRMSRRDVLLAGMGAAVVSVTAHAAEPPEASAPGVADAAQFLTLSLRLTDRETLSPAIGNALYARIVQAVPERKEQISRLHALLQQKHFESAQALAKAAEQVDPVFRDVIHDIMTGWYRGVAAQKVVVYRSALMFDITKDAVYPKTYATGGPFYWTSKPPEVPLPTGEPGLSPSKFVVEPT
ncbi:sorbitol dehydrogenase family protein [Acetobacter tropicalis]